MPTYTLHYTFGLLAICLPRPSMTRCRLYSLHQSRH